jgi:hypothetical protein
MRRWYLYVVAALIAALVASRSSERSKFARMRRNTLSPTAGPNNVENCLVIEPGGRARWNFAIKNFLPVVQPWIHTKEAPSMQIAATKDGAWRSEQESDHHESHSLESPTYRGTPTCRANVWKRVSERRLSSRKSALIDQLRSRLFTR